MTLSKDSYLVQVEPARAAAGDVPSASAVYRNYTAKDGFPTVPGCSTLYELFKNSVEKYGSRECLGVREVAADGTPSDFKFLTYSQVGALVADVASGLVANGAAPKDSIGIYGPNCPEWMVSMQACNRHSMNVVPLYDTLGADAIEYIANHAACKVAMCAVDKLPMLVKALPKCTTVQVVVYWGKLAAKPELPPGMKLLSWEELMAQGKAAPAEPNPPSPDDLCTIMYTSGTTGDPKGVMLKHSSVLVTLYGVLEYVKKEWEVIDMNDVFLSYLPLAHIFDRVVEEMFLFVGGKIGYWRGDVKLLVDDIGALKPTIFIGVPRIFDRIYAGVQAKMAPSFIKRFLFGWGSRSKLAKLQAGYSYKKAAPLFDRILFNTVKQRLGGRVRIIISGAAPLSRHVEDFLRVAMCCPVVQGFGLTETCAASFIAKPDDCRFVGSVGIAMPTVNLRLESVPDMNYDACPTVPGRAMRGEVCISGPPLFQAYYKAEQMTADVVDSEGFFHTGDIGEIDPDTGSLRIIDRKKNIFKLAQGEYVAVEKLEEAYSKCDLCDMLWVYGNSFETTLIIVVVPNEAKMLAWAKAEGAGKDLAAICQSDKAKAYLLKTLQDAGRAAKLKGFEIVKAIHLDAVPFDMERDLLTPTFKKKRPQLLKYYQKPIDDLYLALKAKESVQKNAI